jgi:hypothetical protein
MIDISNYEFVPYWAIWFIIVVVGATLAYAIWDVGFGRGIWWRPILSFVIACVGDFSGVFIVFANESAAEALKQEISEAYAIDVSNSIANDFLDASRSCFGKTSSEFVARDEQTGTSTTLYYDVIDNKLTLYEKQGDEYIPLETGGK